MHSYLLSCVKFFETPPGYSIHGISQASIPESVVIPFSWGSSQPRDWTRVFCIGRQIFHCLSHQGSPCMYTQSLHLCPNICDSMDRSLPGSSVHGIFPAWILEWVAMPSSRGSSWPRDRAHVFCIARIAGGFFTDEPPGKFREACCCCCCC